ncbi:MAG: hypothetical protein MSG64_09645 [Pyrinomonadaceae bacterium MAG19_C2-C3]|nr:hypothetical protein [Pyrinomonadaceae bacterium MAG19_C2-C3]
MRNSPSGFTAKLSAVAFLSLFGICTTAIAQNVTGDGRAMTNTANSSLSQQHIIVAKDAELSCGGMIEYAPAARRLEIIGGEEEQEQRVFSTGDVVYLSGGANLDLRVGEELSIARPRGQFKSDFSRKKGFLGVYTQELGRLRITQVREQVSVAEITSACGEILFGDYLRSLPNRQAPQGRAATPIDRFAPASGKQQGRIVLAREGRELVSRNQVVFIDLGEEDSVKVGDYLTVFRPVGKGNITNFRDEEIVVPASGGFQSEEFNGGKFSNQATRVKNPNETGVYGPVVTSPDIKKRRPQLPRKIVGEMVVIATEQRTATAIITRTAQEINTGDYVEVQ